MAKRPKLPESTALPRLADDISRDAVMRLILRLSHRSKLEVHDWLSEMLAAAGEPPSQHQATIDAQREVRDLMADAAEEFGLPDGQAPTKDQFNAHARTVGASWDHNKVGRLFASFGLAQRFYTTGRLPDAAAVVRQRQKLDSARRLTSPVEHLDLVAEWVADRDGQEDLDSCSYERWRKEYNHARADSPARLAASWHHMTQAFPCLTVEDIIEAAKATSAGVERDLTERSRQRAEELIATSKNPLRLITGTTAAGLLGMTAYAVRDAQAVGTPNFPVVVARLGAKDLYLEQDVRKYLSNGQAPRRRRYEMNHRLLTSTQVAPRIGLTDKGLSSRLRRRTGGLPEPDGVISTNRYWLPETIEAWLDSSR